MKASWSPYSLSKLILLSQSRNFSDMSQGKLNCLSRRTLRAGPLSNVGENSVFGDGFVSFGRYVAMFASCEKYPIPTLGFQDLLVQNLSNVGAPCSGEYVGFCTMISLAYLLTSIYGYESIGCRSIQNLRRNGGVVQSQTRRFHPDWQRRSP